MNMNVFFIQHYNQCLIVIPVYSRSKRTFCFVAVAVAAE